jgi:hypothetical protein
MSSVATQIIEKNDEVVAALWSNVFLMVWQGVASAEQLRRIGAHQRTVDNNFPDGFCVLAIISGSSLIMPPDVRAEAEILSRSPGKNLKAIAQVITATGFAAAATRAIASGLALLRKSTVPSKFFGDIPSAARFLMPYVTPGPDGASLRAEDLLVAIERARTA